MSNVLPFFRAWLAHPMIVGAVIPSGRALSRAITAEIGPETGRVIELGGGTGAFTQMLLERGVPAERLAVVELSSDFARMLKRRFPAVRVVSMDATRLGAVDLFAGEEGEAAGPVVGAVVSGLPVLSMPPRKVMGIVSGAFRHLKPGGAFYQFTYGPRCPVARPILDRLGLVSERRQRAWANLPPATVYRITRRRDA